MLLQNPVVEAYFFFCKKPPVCVLQLCRLAVVRAVSCSKEGTYVFCQISSPLELPHGQETVDLAARIGALRTDLSVSAWVLNTSRGGTH